MNGIRLESDRLALREWKSGDADAIYRLMGDAEVVRYLSWNKLTRAQCDRRLDDFIFDQRCRLSEDRFSRLGESRLARAVRKRILSRSGAAPIRCDGQSDCRRYRYYFAVELKSSSRVIGEAGFEWDRNDRATRRAEIGYFLEKEFWGQGYATEAALLVMDFAFTKLGSDEVSAACDPRNQASAKVMRRCGLMRAQAASPDEPIRMNLSKSAWQNARDLRRTAAR
jgi:RimJ/RimL family protein N-acetyltransferase